MALIEYLEYDHWQEVLQRNFELALNALEKKDYRMGSSALDDLKAWLSLGGVSRVHLQLNQQMDSRRFSPERKTAVNTYVKTLAQQHRDKLLHLMAIGEISVTPDNGLADLGYSAPQFEELVQQVKAGQNPFKQWMYDHGYSDTEIAEIYKIIDDWLAKSVQSNN